MHNNNNRYVCLILKSEPVSFRNTSKQIIGSSITAIICVITDDMDKTRRSTPATFAIYKTTYTIPISKQPIINAVHMFFIIHLITVIPAGVLT